MQLSQSSAFRWSFLVVLGGLFLLTLPFQAHAQEEEAPNDSTNAEDEAEQSKESSSEREKAEDMQYHVIDFRGDVSVRLPEKNENNTEKNNAEERKWQQPKVGMELPDGTEVSTGIESRMAVTIGDYGSVIVNQLVQGSIDYLYRDGDQLEGRIELDTGKVRVHIEGDRIEANFQVSTPRTVASVRGSVVDVLARGDTGDEVYVAKGWASFPGLPSRASLTAHQRIYEQGLSGEYLSNVESARVDFVASTNLEGMTRAENRALMKEVATSGVRIVPGDIEEFEEMVTVFDGLGSLRLIRDGETVSDFAKELKGLGQLMKEENNQANQNQRPWEDSTPPGRE